MTKRDNNLYVQDILECIERINEYTMGLSFEGFTKDEKTIDAVIRKLEVIGEASRQLPQDFKDSHPTIEWQTMTAFRNVIVHEYFGINYSIIWDIIKNELPSLTEKIKKITS